MDLNKNWNPGLMNLQSSSSRRILDQPLPKDAYKTADDLSSTRKKLQQQFVQNDKNFDNQIEWNETYVDETFDDDDDADIDDSICLDEVTVSQKSINASFINIKRNKPLEYKLKNTKF